MVNSDGVNHVAGTWKCAPTESPIYTMPFASLPPHNSSSREFPEVSLTPKIPLQFESPKTSLFSGRRPGLYFSSKSEQSRPLQMEPRNLSTGLNLDLEKNSYNILPMWTELAFFPGNRDNHIS